MAEQSHELAASCLDSIHVYIFQEPLCREVLTHLSRRHGKSVIVLFDLYIVLYSNLCM